MGSPAISHACASWHFAARGNFVTPLLQPQASNQIRRLGSCILSAQSPLSSFIIAKGGLAHASIEGWIASVWRYVCSAKDVHSNRIAVCPCVGETNSSLPPCCRAIALQTDNT